MILLSLLMLFTVGCKLESSNNESIKDDGTEIVLPEGLRMDCTMPEYYPEKLGLYAIEWQNVSADVAVEIMMSGTPQEKFDHAEGVGYRYTSEKKETEILYINNNELNSGGFSFIKEEAIEKLNNIDKVTRVIMPDFSKQQTGNELYSFFSENKELSFAAKEEVKRKFQNIMDELDYGDIKISILARDAVTMNHNREIYNRICEEIAGTYGGSRICIEDSFIEADEDYWITMKQTVEDVSVLGEEWYRVNIGGTSTASVIEAYYNSEYGLMDMRVVHYFHITDKLNTLNIISPVQALQVYLDYYNKSIHLTNTDILNIELNYVILTDAEGLYIRPCWAIYTKIQTGRMVETTGEYQYEYPIYIITADTGSILNGNEVPRG